VFAGRFVSRCAAPIAVLCGAGRASTSPSRDIRGWPSVDVTTAVAPVARQRLQRCSATGAAMPPCVARTTTTTWEMSRSCVFRSSGNARCSRSSARSDSVWRVISTSAVSTSPRNMAIAGRAAITATSQVATTRHGQAAPPGEPPRHGPHRTRVKMLCIQGAQLPFSSRSHQATESVPFGFTAMAPSSASSY
jgi:hypothetical protein